MNGVSGIRPRYKRYRGRGVRFALDELLPARQLVGNFPSDITAVTGLRHRGTYFTPRSGTSHRIETRSGEGEGRAMDAGRCIPGHALPSAAAPTHFRFSAASEPGGRCRTALTSSARGPNLAPNVCQRRRGRCSHSAWTAGAALGPFLSLPFPSLLSLECARTCCPRQRSPAQPNPAHGAAAALRAEATATATATATAAAAKRPPPARPPPSLVGADAREIVAASAALSFAATCRSPSRAPPPPPPPPPPRERREAGDRQRQPPHAPPKRAAVRSPLRNAHPASAPKEFLPSQLG
ncbi:Protein of unknown function [Gryllus bimaculatus]|nr:Protein of unknown function [Gryllus bimaculatus]